MNWGGVRANVGVAAGSGKFMFEVSVQDEGLCRVGWSTDKASLDLGTDKLGYGYGGTGRKVHDRKFDPWGQPFGGGDVVGCLVDHDANQITFRKNGVDLGIAFPLAGVTSPLFPTISLKNCEVLVNLGSAPFRFPLPGFVGVTAAGPRKVLSSAVAPPPEAAGAGAGKTDVKTAPLALILEPTRELAQQTAEVLESLQVHTAVRTVLLMGGGDTRQAQAALRTGCEVVVATPGVLQEFVKSGKLDLGCIRVFVIDEADRMADEENTAIVMDVFNRLPKGAVAGEARLQVCFFSATLHSPEIKALSEKLCQHPTWVDLKGKDSVPDTVHHLIISVDPAVDHTWAALKDEVPTDGVHASDRVGSGVSLIELSEGTKRLKPALFVALADSLKMDQCMVFCRTNVDCDNLEKYLVKLGGGRAFTGKMEKGKENKYSCCVLAGMRSMQERQFSLKCFSEGDVRFLICTDVAARGIDIKGLPYVVNMTLPDESENYIHRIGRVGRADRLGLALSFATNVKEKVWYHKCRDRGRGCTNTNLVDKGGCTIWYDEPAYLEAIEKRLGAKIEAIAPIHDPGNPLRYRFQLPEWAASLSYGEDRVGPQETSEHIAAISGRVETLAELERRSQLSFHDMNTRFTNIIKRA